MHRADDPCRARGLRLALRLEYSHNPSSDSAFLRRVAVTLGDADADRLIKLIGAARAPSSLLSPAGKLGALVGGALGAALAMAGEGGKLGQLGGPGGGAVIPSARTEDQAGGGEAQQPGASPLGPPSAPILCAKLHDGTAWPRCCLRLNHGGPCELDPFSPRARKAGR